MTAANLADGVRTVGLPLTALAFGGGAIEVGTVIALLRAPALIVGVLGGAVIDRVERRTVLIGVHAGRAMGTGVFAVLLAGGYRSLLAVYAVALLSGLAESLGDGAAGAALPRLVAAERLGATNAALQVSFTASQLVGPLLGAAAFALGPAIPFLLEALLAAAALAGAMRLPCLSMAAAALTRSWGALAGFSWIRRTRGMAALTAVAGVINLAVGGAEAMLTIYAAERLGAPWAVGLLTGGLAAGALLGGVAAARLPSESPDGWRLVGAASTLVLGLALLASTTSIALAVAAQMVTGVAAVIWTVRTTVLRQRATPDALQGRVVTSHSLVAGGCAMLGAAAAGVVADTSTVSAVYGAAAAVAGVALLGVLVRRAEIDDLMVAQRPAAESGLL